MVGAHLMLIQLFSNGLIKKNNTSVGKRDGEMRVPSSVGRINGDNSSGGQVTCQCANLKPANPWTQKFQF